MNKELLGKVLSQIISETTIDYRRNRVYFDFWSIYNFMGFDNFVENISSTSFFNDHCQDVYSLNEDEKSYLWGKYYGAIVTNIFNYYRNG